MDCDKKLCDENIKTISDFRKWSKSNHPDKFTDDGEKNKATKKFQDISECKSEILDKEGRSPKCRNNNNVKVDAKKAECIRNVENWSKIQKQHRFDKQTYDPNQMLNDLPIASPKLLKMIENIRKLDKNDMKKDGKLYKHFIFSDVKKGGYGAKIIASGLIAHGFNSCFPFKGWDTLRIDIPKANANKETFGLLSSTAIYNTPFTQKHVKSVLSIYNKRPNNVHGDDMRFIIFDSGFKEGIDLFDVKYVHIFENQKNSADLTQAVGRATRSCGQKGLRFIPNEGWKLDVYQYYTVLENKEKLFDVYMDYAGIDFNQLVFRENLEKLAILSAVDYDLNYQINKYKKDEFLELTYVKDDKKESLLLLEGGNDDNKMYGCSSGKCGSRSTKTIPFSLKLMEVSFKKFYKKNKSIVKNYKKLTSKEKRQLYCTLLREDTNFCKYVNENYVKKPQKKEKTKPSDKQLIVYDAAKKTTSSTFSTNETNMNIIVPYENVKKNLDSASAASDSMDYDDFRKYINKTFKKFKYEPFKVVNNCEKKSNSTSSPLDDRLVNFTESQSFISNYFTPHRSMKGMLIWHSVGTGKTCTAISAKSYLFEREDYHILWVTRSTLREDIWKNMFDKVCDHVIRDRLSKGEHIPPNPTQIRKYVSKRFLPPMSYRQFSNTLEGKNDYAQKLRAANGSNDILKKTLIIIDEAHKLFSKDLVAMERPDMGAIKKAIHNSYKTSGKDSCKMLLMTATPIADDTMEFIKLMNLIIGDERKRFPEEYADFSKTYLESNTFSKRGKKEFQDNIKGLISYLDRRYDPRQFTQATFHTIPVELSTLPENMKIDVCEKSANEKYIECTSKIEEKHDSTTKDIESDIETKSIQIEVLKEENEKIKKNIKKKKESIRSQKVIKDTNVNVEVVKDDIKKLENEMDTNKFDTNQLKVSIKNLKQELNASVKTKKTEMRQCANEKKMELKECKKLNTSSLYQHSVLSQECKVLV